jgi:hypothetical protein
LSDEEPFKLCWSGITGKKNRKKTMPQPYCSVAAAGLQYRCRIASPCISNHVWSLEEIVGLLP